MALSGHLCASAGSSGWRTGFVPSAQCEEIYPARMTSIGAYLYGINASLNVTKSRLGDCLGKQEKPCRGCQSKSFSIEAP
jgi:hypothetical protein